MRALKGLRSPVIQKKKLKSAIIAAIVARAGFVLAVEGLTPLEAYPRSRGGKLLGISVELCFAVVKGLRNDSVFPPDFCVFLGALADRCLTQILDGARHDEATDANPNERVHLPKRHELHLRQEASFCADKPMETIREGRTG